jgi:hypothetical protein
MFDRSACAKMRLAVEPHTNLSALVMLGALLQDVRNKRSTASDAADSGLSPLPGDQNRGETHGSRGKHAEHLARIWIEDGVVTRKGFEARAGTFRPPGDAGADHDGDGGGESCTFARVRANAPRDASGCPRRRDLPAANDYRRRLAGRHHLQVCDR